MLWIYLILQLYNYFNLFSTFSHTFSFSHLIIRPQTLNQPLNSTQNASTHSKHPVSKNHPSLSKHTPTVQHATNKSQTLTELSETAPPYSRLNLRTSRLWFVVRRLSRGWSVIVSLFRIARLFWPCRMKRLERLIGICVIWCNIVWTGLFSSWRRWIQCNLRDWSIDRPVGWY